MNERDDPLWHFVNNRLPGPPSAQFFGWGCIEFDVERGTIAVEFAPPPEWVPRTICAKFPLDGLGVRNDIGLFVLS